MFGDFFHFFIFLTLLWNLSCIWFEFEFQWHEAQWRSYCRRYIARLLIKIVCKHFCCQKCFRLTFWYFSHFCENQRQESLLWRHYRQYIATWLLKLVCKHFGIQKNVWTSILLFFTLLWKIGGMKYRDNVTIDDISLRGL